MCRLPFGLLLLLHSTSLGLTIDDFKSGDVERSGRRTEIDDHLVIGQSGLVDVLSGRRTIGLGSLSRRPEDAVASVSVSSDGSGTLTIETGLFIEVSHVQYGKTVNDPSLDIDFTDLQSSVLEVNMVSLQAEEPRQLNVTLRNTTPQRKAEADVLLEPSDTPFTVQIPIGQFMAEHTPDFDPSSVEALSIAFYNLFPGDRLEVDNIRVVPEPSSGILGGIVICGVLGIRTCRKYRPSKR